jgi:hypothetical protein
MIADLEGRCAGLTRQEQALAQALASGPWPLREPAQQPAPPDSARSMLLERRRALVAEIEQTREKVRASRERLEMALENLRLQLSRIRAGAGSAAGAMEDVEAARVVLAEAAVEPASRAP